MAETVTVELEDKEEHYNAVIRYTTEHPMLNVIYLKRRAVLEAFGRVPEKVVVTIKAPTPGIPAGIGEVGE